MDEDYEILFNLLPLIMLLFTAFWILKWCCGADSFHSRYRINQGFFLIFFSNVVANVVGIVVVIILIETYTCELDDGSLNPDDPGYESIKEF